MDQDIKKQIEEIIGEIQCPFDFECFRSGFDTDTMCKVKDIGMERYLDCFEHKPLCPFSLSAGPHHYCSCPLRVYICKKLGK
jgi:hypothetical protein